MHMSKKVRIALVIAIALTGYLFASDSRVRYDDAIRYCIPVFLVLSYWFITGMGKKGEESNEE